MDNLWIQIVTWALPAGSLCSALTWIVTRHKRDNDFLSEMQRSIDLLSERYNQTLQENVTLRQEKADWQVMQQELLLKVDRLTLEVESLRRNINKKQKKDEKHTPHPTAHRTPTGDRLRNRTTTELANDDH